MTADKKVATLPGNGEWKPWADSILRKVREALAKGIPDIYRDYPTPVEGFCFELHADLPYGNRALLAEVNANMVKMLDFQELDALFNQKYGCSFL